MSDKASDKLLNCPFCGGEAGIDSDKIGKEKKLYYAYCKNDCITQYGYYSSRESAIKAWNTRKPMERILERLEEESKKNRDKGFELERKEGMFNLADKFYSKHYAFMGAIKIVKEEGGIE